MKKKRLVPLLLLSLLCLSFQNPFDITIKFKDLKSSKGAILLELVDENKELIKGAEQSIYNDTCIIVLNGLAPGKYAFKYFHDANDNKKIDTNVIGIPKEGFGFSNNAKGTFGPPAHKKTIFELKSDTVFSCSPIYLK